MVEVVLTNLQRIDQLWPIFLSHVMELLSHPKASIRNAAVDALAKAVVGALSHVNALAEGGHEKVRWLVLMLSQFIMWVDGFVMMSQSPQLFSSIRLHQDTHPGQTPLKMQGFSCLGQVYSERHRRFSCSCDVGFCCCHCSFSCSSSSCLLVFLRFPPVLLLTTKPFCAG